MISGGRFSQEAEDLLFDRLTGPPSYNPISPEFKYLKNDHCYVIVHPGYAITWDVLTPEDKYGLYSDYYENLKRLISSLKDSNELTIFAVEERVYDGEKYEDGLTPFDSSLKIITKNNTNEAKKIIKTPEGRRRQEMEEVFSFLLSLGVQEARFAGEWTWHHGNGCLTKLAEDFKNAGFTVKAVGGCFFPSRRPEESSALLETFYSDPIKVIFTR